MEYNSPSILLKIIDVTKAIENFNNIISPAIKEASLSTSDQSRIDDLLISLDGTENKSRLGANAILGASMLFVKASAQEKVSLQKIAHEIFCLGCAPLPASQ